MKLKDAIGDQLMPVTDDPFLPSLTLRVLVIGSIWCMFLSVANTIFSFRTTTFEIPSILAAILGYPMGIFMSRVIPKKTFHLWGRRLELNNGDFSVKEHVLVYIIASAGSTAPNGLANVVIQKMDMFMGNSSIGGFHALIWILSTQLIGFGMVGIMRRFLIKPAELIWPNTLSDVALFVGFHEKGSSTGISRLGMFWYGACGMFLYSWFPLYITPILQSLPLLCLLKDSRLKFLGSAWPIPSGYGGIGIGSITFDWSQLRHGSMTSPWWATLNIAVGNIIWTWILTPIFYYRDAFGMDSSLKYQQRPVLNTGSLFNKNGTAIKPFSICNETTADINLNAYHANAPIYITTFFAMNYGASFLGFTASFTHVICWYGKSIMRRIHALLTKTDDKVDDHDIHNELMKHYTYFSEGMYLLFLFGSIILHVFVNTVSPFRMPLWSVFLSIFIAFVSILPFGMIQAVTGYPLGINLPTQLIIGLLIPGNTLGVMSFKILGSTALSQALTFLCQMKFAHYMKINPKHLVIAQLYGTVLGAICSTSAFFVILDSMKHLLGTHDWLFSDYHIFYNSGVIWGSIGPQRFFGIGAPYQALLLCFPLGIILPLLLFLLNEYYPTSIWKSINVPLICSITGPGRVQNYQISSVAISWFFQNFMLNNYNNWWKKYNYILAVAFSSGVALCGLMVTILHQAGHNFPHWALNPIKRESFCEPQ